MKATQGCVWVVNRKVFNKKVFVSSVFVGVGRPEGVAVVPFYQGDRGTIV